MFCVCFCTLMGNVLIQLDCVWSEKLCTDAVVLCSLYCPPIPPSLPITSSSPSLLLLLFLQLLLLLSLSWLLCLLFRFVVLHVLLSIVVVVVVVVLAVCTTYIYLFINTDEDVDDDAKFTYAYDMLIAVLLLATDDQHHRRRRRHHCHVITIVDGPFLRFLLLSCHTCVLIFVVVICCGGFLTIDKQPCMRACKEQKHNQSTTVLKGDL